MIAAWAAYAVSLAILLLLLITSPPLASLRRGVLWFAVAACSAASAVALVVAGDWLSAVINGATAAVAVAGWLHWRAVRKRAAA